MKQPFERLLWGGGRSIGAEWPYRISTSQFRPRASWKIALSFVISCVVVRWVAEQRSSGARRAVYAPSLWRRHGRTAYIDLSASVRRERTRSNITLEEEP
jgi:hypothetical protein